MWWLHLSKVGSRGSISYYRFKNMDSIEVRNFRSIVDSGKIQLNSINVLLGENSSGKSSFIRLFPMFKESAQHELRGPLLWFDEQYDFGSFLNAKSRHATNDTIGFSFRWQNNDVKKKGKHYLGDASDVFDKYKVIEVEMQIAEFSGTVFLKKLRIQFMLKASKKHIDIIEVEDINKKLSISINSRLISTNRYYWNYNIKRVLPDLNGKSDIFTKLRDLQSVLASDKNSLLYDAITGGFGFTEKEISSFLGTSYPDSVKEMDQTRLNEIMDSLMLFRVVDAIEYVDKYLTAYFCNVYYITPLRYNFTRYMRKKDLAVDYIAPDGRNVMEYIMSLSSEEMVSYTEFIKSTINAEVRIKGEENIGIYIINEDGEEDNIVDVGYGFSQVLPIATMLWDRAYKKVKGQSLDTIVIEQPEVHLHPHMQAKLSKLFLEAIHLAKSRGKKLCLVIETHSSVLVNQLGKYVYYNQEHIQEMEKKSLVASNRDISIYLFEKKQGVANIVATEFDEMGRIKKWPIGFLD